MSDRRTAMQSQAAVDTLLRGQFEEHSHESRELQAFPGVLHGCDRFLDVGSNTGLYVFHANRILHEAEIVAVEANPALKPVIEEVWERAVHEADNGNRLSIESFAIYDESGSIDFYLTPSLDDSSMNPDRIARATRITVPARPLDTFYQPSKKTLIKMDIEGAEYRGLLSGQKFLKSRHTEFFMELHPWGDGKLRKYPLQVCGLFFAYGYGCRRVYHHYHFVREGFVPRTIHYLLCFPHFLLMWGSNRYPGTLGRMIAGLHAILAKIRRLIFP